MDTLRQTHRTGFAISVSVIFARDSGGSLFPMQHDRSNQSLQLTAGRSDASHYIMKTFPFQSMLAPASGS
jgi:hypothetical protein